MKRLRQWLFLVCAAGFLATDPAYPMAVAMRGALSSSEARDRKNLPHEFPDLSYDESFPELKLDLYLPARKAARGVPLVVLIHGGCFMSGSRKDMTWFAKEFQKEGFAAATVSYRLVPRHFYPAALHDVQEAVRFLRRNHAILGIDPERIGAMGLSAGGYLAAALGVRPILGRQTSRDALSAAVRAVVDHYGRTDFTLPQRNPDADCAEKFLGFSRRQDPRAFEEASILPYVSRASAVFQIAHGTNDQQVIPYHSEVLHERLQQAGVHSELIWVTGAGHGFTGQDFTRTWNAALRFFREWLLFP